MTAEPEPQPKVCGHQKKCCCELEEELKKEREALRREQEAATAAADLVKETAQRAVQELRKPGSKKWRLPTPQKGSQSS